MSVTLATLRGQRRDLSLKVPFQFFAFLEVVSDSRPGLVTSLPARPLPSTEWSEFPSTYWWVRSLNLSRICLLGDVEPSTSCRRCWARERFCTALRCCSIVSTSYDVFRRRWRRPTTTLPQRPSSPMSRRPSQDLFWEISYILHKGGNSCFFM